MRGATVTRRALAAGTAVSFAVAAAWAYSTSLTSFGPAPAPRLTASPAADYAQLASGTTGSVPELFAVLAAVFAVSLFASGWRLVRGRRDA
jgi:hypothetical protein